MGARETIRKSLLGYPMVMLLLLALWILAVSAGATKCCSSDEIVHILAGYSYWNLGDYTIDPENGNLPQRIAALPLLLGNYHLPSFEQHPGWTQWMLGYEFLYNMGNDANWILLQSRMAIGTVAVLMGLVVYYWSRKLYGPGGGIISTALYAFSTIFLANGALATSDLVAALFFLCSVGCLWALLQKVTPWRLAGSCMAMALLFVSKMSAPLVIPMAVGLVLIRLADGRPLPLALGRAREAVGKANQTLVCVGLVVAHALTVWVVIWAFYGFRFEIISPLLPQEMRMRCDWRKINSPSLQYPLKSFIQVCRDERLLPESYLYGQAFVLRWAEDRPAFLNGDYRIYGWWYYFPYTLLVKTPLTFFAVLALAVTAAVLQWRRGAKVSGKDVPGKPRVISTRSAAWAAFYRTAPLWVLLFVYWAISMASKINIGHRHILTTYPPMFILAGATVYWFTSRRRAVLGVVTGLLLAAYAVEAVLAWPNYIAYFNQIIGGPANGYKHMVDSSLDWGQDLPALKQWLEKEGLNGQDKTPVYLSYFGTGNPTWHGIKARRLKGYMDVDLEGGDYAPTTEGGVYCVSATILRTVLMRPLLGPWSTLLEEEYQKLVKAMNAFKVGDPEMTEFARSRKEEWANLKINYEKLRIARLCAYLRHRTPVAQPGYSILVYRLTDEEAHQAVLGSPVELVQEDTLLFERLRRQQ